MAKKYYDKLFTEYCLADFGEKERRYKEGKVGLRWRVRREVMAGKGQFVCGNVRCDGKDELRSYEVNFAYVEAGARKQALVKLRLCPGCAYKLNYRKIKELEKAERKAMKKDKTSTKKSEKASDGSSRRKRERQDSEKSESPSKVRVKSEPAEPTPESGLRAPVGGAADAAVPSRRRRGADDPQRSGAATADRTTGDFATPASPPHRGPTAAPSSPASAAPSRATPTAPVPSSPRSPPTSSFAEPSPKLRDEDQAIFEDMFKSLFD